jgi:hypothetical protein
MLGFLRCIRIDLHIALAFRMSSGYCTVQPPGLLRLYNQIWDEICRYALLQRLLHGTGRGLELRYSRSVQLTLAKHQRAIATPATPASSTSAPTRSPSESPALCVEIDDRGRLSK